jgi:CRISPR locus-related DNA-binding protein
MENRCIHIVPIGFEYDRVVRPLLKYSVDEVILLRSSNVEFQKQHELEEHFLKKLEGVPVPMRTVEIDIYDFDQMFRSLYKLIREESAGGRKVYINLSAAPKLESIALIMAASMCRETGDIRLIYIKPEEYLQGRMLWEMRQASRKPAERAKEMLTSSTEEFMEKGVAHGLKEIIELAPLPVELPSETEHDILQGLAEGEVDSLKELVDRVRKSKKKIPRSNVVYHLESLRKKNLVTVEAGNGKKVQVRLNRTGELFLEALKSEAG